MAGSLTWRSYTGDNGVAYSVKCDESNANATVAVAGGTASTALLPIRTTNLPIVPNSLRLRYANAYNRTNPNQRRRFRFTAGAVATIMLSDGALITTEDYPAAGGAAAGVAQTWVVTSITGEKSRKAPAFGAADTGLTDNTVSQ